MAGGTFEHPLQPFAERAVSYQFPTPEAVPGYAKRFTLWGTKPEKLFGRSTKFELKRKGRIPTATVGGITFVLEPETDAIARMAREDAQARAELEAAE
jgi:hypothetical protein